MTTNEPGPSVREGPSGVHLTEVGEGIPVFLLHGIGSSGAVFDDQLPLLADEHHVVAWDAPGYGRSADPDGPLGLDDFADIAAECIRDSFADGAHVVGMSWGGVIATRLALRHPELVRSLVLGSSTVGSGGDPGKAEEMRGRPEELGRVGATAFAAARAVRLVSPDATEETKQRATALMESSIRLPGYGYAAESMATTDHTGDLGDVTVPTLVFWGDRDGVTGRDAAVPLIAGIPGAVGVEVRDAGHLTNLESPENVTTWIASFALIAERMKESGKYRKSTRLPAADL
jgi:3-oxoadipate enol-lactonase